VFTAKVAKDSQRAAEQNCSTMQQYHRGEKALDLNAQAPAAYPHSDRLPFPTSRNSEGRPEGNSMSQLRVHTFSISIDDFGAGPNQDLIEK
jgi:hypothetical protein